MSLEVSYIYLRESTSPDSAKESHFNQEIFSAFGHPLVIEEQVFIATAKGRYGQQSPYTHWKKTNGTSVQNEDKEDDKDTTYLSILRERLHLP